jgi:hypothetical protein
MALHVLSAGLVLGLVAALRPLLIRPPSVLAGNPASVPETSRGPQTGRSTEVAHPEKVTVGFYVYDLLDLNPKPARSARANLFLSGNIRAPRVKLPTAISSTVGIRCFNSRGEPRHS